MHQFVNRRTAARRFSAATALGVFSALQAYNYVALFSERRSRSPCCWPQPLLLVRVGAARAVRAVAGTPLPVRTRRWTRALGRARAGGGGLHLRARDAARDRAASTRCSWLAGREVDWWLGVRERFFLYFDWEMMTYWAIIAVEPRLRLLPRVAGARLTDGAARDPARRGAAAGAAAAAAPAFPLQHAPHHLGADAPQHRRRRRHAGAPERPAAPDARPLGTQVVTLKDELDFVEKYLEIERTRFGDRLQVRVRGRAATPSSASVPNFILQPLVENALRHGIGPKLGGGTRGGDARARTSDWLQLVVQRRRPRRASGQAECLQHRRRAGQHAVASRAPVSGPRTGSSSRPRRPAAWR